MVALATWFAKQNVGSGLKDLQIKIGGWRDHDKKETREWIDGSFIRAGEVNAKMEGLEHRVAALERN